VAGQQAVVLVEELVPAEVEVALVLEVEDLLVEVPVEEIQVEVELVEVPVEEQLLTP